MPKRLTREEFIERARAIHGDKYNYDKVVYVNSSTKVIIDCPKHGDFSQTPAMHLSGNGCGKCYSETRGLKHTKTQERFLEESHKTHGDKYDYSEVVYIGQRVPITIICRKHGRFTQNPKEHLRGHGCPKCGVKSAHEQQSMKESYFLEQAKIVHGSKYDYSKVLFTNGKTKVEIVCPEHGSFWITPYNHIVQKQGCKACGMKRGGDKNRKTLEQFVEEARVIHGNRYDYTCSEYTTTKAKIRIRCSQHGFFYQTAYEHLCGCNCPKCAAEEAMTGVYGVGVNDVPNSQNLQAHKTWVSMLGRCYNPIYLEKEPTYKGCSVSEEWLTFSNFKKWFENPENGYMEGYHLDKDIILQGNKVYSPETCCFVPHSINCIFGTSTNKTNDLPIGVGYKHNRITAELSRYGKTCNLGYFDSVDDAFRAYKEAKETYIKEVAAEYYSGGKITKRVYDALMRWKIEITS